MVVFTNVKKEDAVTLKKLGFTPLAPKTIYEVIRYQKDNVTLILYESEKLLLQGKAEAVDKITDLLSQRGVGTLDEKKEIKFRKETGWMIRESKSKPGQIKKLKWSHMEDRLKYNLLEKYFHPINFKIIDWKKDRQFHHKNIEKNKIIEDFSIVENADNLECFDLSRTSKTFQTKVYGVKIAIHNKVEKKTIIVSGLVDDLLITCIDNEYLNIKMEKLIQESAIQSDHDADVFQRFIHSITLKELIVYSTSELINKYQGHLSQIVLIKQKPVSQVVKEFINSDLHGQRTTLIQLLLKSDEHEYQYLAYLLYDLLLKL